MVELVLTSMGRLDLFFRTFRGLRQGDPLSPLLFNIAADALAEIIDIAQRKGLVKGVISHLVPGGVPILQYADDTVIMMECEDDYYLHLKFLLYCFEWMSGLKINYHKSEVHVMGVDQEEADRVANIFYCKLAQLPMNYLGILIGDRHIGMKAAENVLSKLNKRLNNWRNKLLSSGGRLVLSNSSLSSLPIYTMGFYRFNEGVHQKMDSIRSIFFLERC